MVGGHKCLPRAVQLDAANLDVTLVIDVVEVKDGEDAGIGPPPLEMFVDVDALKERVERARRQAPHPLVEVSKNDLGALYAFVVDEAGKTGCLIATLEHRGAEMHVIDVQCVYAKIEVGA